MADKISEINKVYINKKTSDLVLETLEIYSSKVFRYVLHTDNNTSFVDFDCGWMDIINEPENYQYLGDL